MKETGYGDTEYKGLHVGCVDMGIIGALRGYGCGVISGGNVEGDTCGA